jgi:hypothetical protein
MVAQLLPEFLKLHAACAEIRIFHGHRFGYFPEPTAVDPLPTFGLAYQITLPDSAGLSKMEDMPCEASGPCARTTTHKKKGNPI